MNHLRRSQACLFAMRWSFATALCAAWSFAANAQDAKPAKATVPTAARQAEIRKLLDETFELFKANTAAKKQQAAQKLMELAGDSATAGDELYVVLATVRPLLREAGDFQTYLATVEQLVTSFQVDVEAERTKLVTDFMMTCKLPTALEPVLNEVVALVGRAVSENRYRAATELLDAADKQAKSIMAAKLSKSLTELRGIVRDREQAFVSQTVAQQALMGKPDDPKANFAVGLWLAVYESDWEQALPKLALGSDARWKAAAVAELKPQSEVEAQLTAGDAWWEVAQSATGEVKLAAQRRAHEWYKRHAPNVKSPLVKARVTKRIEELAASLEAASLRDIAPLSLSKPAANVVSNETNATALPAGAWVDLLELVKLPEHALIGKWKRVEGALVCEPSVDARVLAPVAIRGSYELSVEFTRKSGEDSVMVLIPIGANTCSVVLSGWNGKLHGLMLIDGHDCLLYPPSTKAAFRPGHLANNRRYQLQVEVIQDDEKVAVVATLDDQRIVEWNGNVSQLSGSAAHVLPYPQAVGLLGLNVPVEFHKCALRLKSDGSGYQLGDDWKNPLTPVAVGPSKEIASKCLTWKGRKYFISDKPMTISEAQQLATQLKGRLLTVSSEEEESFLFEQGRGLSFWMSGWRRTDSQDWRDERNRPLRFQGKWTPGQPQRADRELHLGLHTSDIPGRNGRGWHDYTFLHTGHACIEWGEEYPNDK